MDFLNSIKYAFLPELIIICFIFINIFLSLFFNKRFYKLSQWIALLGILTTFISLGLIQAEPTYYAFSGTIISNVFTVFAKSLILISTFFVILNSYKTVKRKKAHAFEYFALMFSGVLGSFIMVSANNFLTVFTGLELSIITCCLMSGILKNYKSKEGSFKYILCGTIASALFLLGTSYIYGITSSIRFDVIENNLLNYQGSLLFTIACFLIITGLLFKINCVPFANWTADTYKGANYPTNIFISTIPVIASFCILARLIYLFANYTPILGITIIILATTTIIYGVYGAIRQIDVKRFMGYNNILHCGYMLMLIGVLSTYSLAGLLYYLICYLFMNIAIWSGLTIFYNSTGKSNITAYKGIAYKHPFYATAMVFVLLALAGLPPTSGFIAKFFVLSAVARLGFIYIIFLLLSLILSAIAIYFYFNFIKTLFDKTTETQNIKGRQLFSRTSFYICTAITILLCLYSGKIIELCELIAYSL